MASLTSLSALPENFVIRPDSLGCIRVTGEETNKYLHGQLTVNVNDLDASTARYAAHCDNKGKAWAVLQVVRHGDAVLLIANADAAEASFAQLQKYGVFSKVDMTLDNPSYQHVILSQAVGREACKQLFGAAPDSDMATVSFEQGVAIQTRLQGAPLHFVLTAGGEAALSEWLANHAQSLTTFEGNTVFEALSIAAGIPAVSGDMIGQYIPQMFNLQAINGIDYDKGCYMGQEVVARTHFLGRNKRAAFIFTLPLAVSSAPGATVEKQLGDNWRRGGNVIRYATLADESYFMAVLANDTGSDDAHRLAELPEHELVPHPLPYSIAQENRGKPGRTGA